MIIHVFDFDSEEEARAFIQGVDFVNDASLGGPMMARDIDSGKWTVEVYDYDFDYDLGKDLPEEGEESGESEDDDPLAVEEQEEVEGDV